MANHNDRIARATFSRFLLAGASMLVASKATASTNQFHGVNWADSRDNFQSGVLYVSGLSSSDTYDSAFATGTAIVSQFMSKLGSNAVRMPINEATISKYWSTYTGAIDAALAKGIVVLGYWDSAKSNKPPDMNAFWSMWKTVTDKYGGNANAYFEVFNEPNMYSKADLVTLYTDWLSRNSTVPRNRVILDGTGNAQNVSDIGSASSLDGCLLAVHDYSFFGSDTWTKESQWVSHFKGEVGNYSDRTVCTEWGGPMSPGSKNGVSYGSLDYSKSPTNYFEAYVRGMSSQLRAWNMGSFYWPGLRDGDWYSMTTKSGTGANITLTVSNQSGLQQLQNSWTNPLPTTGGTSAGGASSGGASNGGASTGGTTSNNGGSNPGTGGASNVGSGGQSSRGGEGGSLATGGANDGGSNLGIGGDASGGGVATGGSTATSARATGGSSGSSVVTNGGIFGVGGAPTAGGTVSNAGGVTGTGASAAASGGANAVATGGAEPQDTTSVDAAADSGSGDSGCSCAVGGPSHGRATRFYVVLGALAAAGLRRVRRRARQADHSPNHRSVTGSV